MEKEQLRLIENESELRIGMLVYVAHDNVRCLLLEKSGPRQKDGSPWEHEDGSSCTGGPPWKTTADEPGVLTCFCDGVRRRSLFEVMTGLENETRDVARRPMGARP